MKKNVQRLLAVTRNLEETFLEQMLSVQHGEYVFPVPVPVGFREPGELPSCLNVTRAWHVNEEYEPDANYLEGTLPDGSSHTINVSVQSTLFPGELLKVAETIPARYIDPELVERGWEKFGGAHTVKSLDGPATVMFNAINRKIHVTSSGGERFVYEGADAKEKIYEIMWDFRTKTDTPASRLSAVQRFYDHLGVDLPF